MTISTQQTYNYGSANEFPNLREVRYGSSLKSRLLYQTHFVNLCGIGPPDLIHWGTHINGTSSLYAKDDFHGIDTDIKEFDGFIGHYHYVNGLYHETYLSIEEYIMKVIGISKTETGDYYWNEIINPTIGFNGGYGIATKREVIVTYCSYDIFTKSDVRIKYVITPKSNSKKSLLAVDKAFLILPNDPNTKKTNVSIAKVNELSNIWPSLNVSLVIRLLIHGDDYSKQLPGLVSFPQIIETPSMVRRMISLLILFLDKGYMTDSNSSFGMVTGCQSNSHVLVKSNIYRNHLVDVIIRLNELDVNGQLTSYTIDLIEKLPNSTDWQLIILKLLKNSNGSNNLRTFIRFISEYFDNNQLYTTQSCLVLLEQIKFLISRQDYTRALKLSQLTIQIMPLDFECWFYLSLCYALNKDYHQALLTLNSAPMVFNKNIDQFDLVNGITDEFTTSFVNNLSNNSEPITEKTFFKYFPLPHDYVNRALNPSENPIHSKSSGYMKHLWSDVFIFNPNVRFPKIGNYFYQSPLICGSPRDMSTVEGSLIKVTGPNNVKLKLSAFSANTISSSILDFSRKSPWGRCYDLLSFIIAKIGWDEIIKIKTLVFNDKLVVANSTDSINFIVNNNDKKSISKSESWLDQLFVLIYEDLKTLMLITAPDKTQNHSILQWEMLGLLGWNVKYNLKVTISSMITSCLGNINNIDNYELSFFNLVQLLTIYDEFILSDINNSQIDIFTDEYSKIIFTNKLIVKANPKVFDNFTKSIVNDYLTLDLVLLLLMKLISWHLRWYQYTPNNLVTKILIKLCRLNSPEYLMEKLQIIFDTNKLEITGYKYFNQIKHIKQFDGDDTIVEYMSKLIGWLQSLSK